MAHAGTGAKRSATRASARRSRRSRCPSDDAFLAPLPAPALRRSAAARGDRHGVRLPAARDRLRRADDRPRRHDAGARARDGPRPLPQPRGRRALREPRPGRRRRAGRPRRGDVRRADRRDGHARPALQRAAPPVHAAAAARRARPRRASARVVGDPGPRRRCRAAARRAARSIPRCTLASDALPRDVPGAAGRRRRPDRALPPRGRGRARESPSRAPAAVASTPGAEQVLGVRGLDARTARATTLFDIDLERAPARVPGARGRVRARARRRSRAASPGCTRTTPATCVLGGEVLAPAARGGRPRARKEIQYVFQNPYASLNPRRTVGQTIARQLELFDPGRKRRCSARVGECLERVALVALGGQPLPRPALRRRAPAGGDRPRARGRADGSWSATRSPRRSTCRCRRRSSTCCASCAARSGLGLLFITHNLALIRTIADRVAVMTQGRIVEIGPTETLLERPSAPYTQELLANTPSIAA